MALKCRISQTRRIRTPRGIERDLLYAFEDELKEAMQEFQGTTATWKHPVKFTIQRKSKGSADIVTTDKIYGYVDQGTRPHIIKPKRPGYPLRFNTAGFRPKTAVRQLGSSAGSPAKPPEAHAMEVQHPGTDAREFTEVIANKSQARLKRRVDKVLAMYGKEK